MNNQLQSIALLSRLHRSILTFISRPARTLPAEAPLRACGFGRIIPRDESKMQSVPPFYALPHGASLSGGLLNEMIGTIMLATLRAS